jgi:TonB family protein
MNQQGPLLESETVTEKPFRWLLWLLYLGLAVLIHILLFRIHWEWPEGPPPPPVEVQQIDPRKLDAIRRQWKEKSLLLNKDQSPKTDAPPPPDARYMSDRNRTVEKEQRARETNVIPKPSSSEVKPQSKKSNPHNALKNRTNLGNLALPFKLDGRPKEVTEEQPRPPRPAQRGGDQAILDDSLPVGSENVLNTQESIYYSFYARLYEEVGPLWQSRTNEAVYKIPVQPGQYTTVVEVILDQQGNLQGIRRIQSSGVELFDQVVDQTWRKIERFPNPPSGLLDRERQVRMAWRFTVSIGQGMNFNYLPPERTQ